MKPERKTYTVEYWTCGNPVHRHATEQGAADCIEKATRPNKMEQRQSVARERRQALLAAHRSGATYRELAEQYGVSRSRVSGLLNTARREDQVEQMEADYRSAFDSGMTPAEFAEKHGATFLNGRSFHERYWAENAQPPVAVERPGSIDALWLQGGKTVNRLKAAGITSEAELTKMTEAELLKIDGIGIKAVQEIARVLAGRGLTLT